jgi:hypothetical protein
MSIETSISMPLKLFYSDDVDINVFINTDLTNYKVRAEIINQLSSSLTLATANVVGGSNSQVQILTSTTGASTFVIHLTHDTLSSPVFMSFLDIEIEDALGHVQTIYYGALNFGSVGINRGCL